MACKETEYIAAKLTALFQSSQWHDLTSNLSLMALYAAVKRQETYSRAKLTYLLNLYHVHEMTRSAKENMERSMTVVAKAQVHKGSDDVVRYMEALLPKDRCLSFSEMKRLKQGLTESQVAHRISAIMREAWEEPLEARVFTPHEEDLLTQALAQA